MKISPIKIGYYAFLGFLGIIAFIIAATVFPITGNLKILVVQSGSMEPAINTGSIVVIRPVSEYKVGDIITFGPVTNTRPATTHRIIDREVAVGEVLYVTKGDANEDPDVKSVAKKDILGKVILDIPYAGYAVDTARKPYGFLALIIIPAAIIISDQMMNIRREVKKMKEKKDEA